MDKQAHFSTQRVFLGKDQWFTFLRTLKNELAYFLDCEIVETSVSWEEEGRQSKSYACGMDIMANVFPEANIQYGGMLCYMKNYDEAVYIDVFFLAYINGKRVKSNSKKYKYFTINYTPEKGWNNPQWLQDEWGEWESYTDMTRWMK